KTDQIVKISAKVNWLVCEQVCLPGNAEVSAEMQVKDEVDELNGDVFQLWHTRLPQNIGDAGVNMKTAVNEMGKNPAWIHLLHWPAEAPKNLEWFPPASNDLNLV